MGVTLLALGALLGSFVIAADVLEKFVVYGRLARQATPFLALLLGVALAAWTRDRSWRAVVGVVIALVLVSAPNF